MSKTENTNVFVRSRIFEELYNRTILGAHAFPVAWILLGWQFNLYNSKFSILFFLGLGALLAAGFFRIATLLWIRKSDVENHFHLKLKLLQSAMILNAIIWSALLVYIILNPELADMHIAIIIISLCIGFITPISVAVNSLMRVTTTLIFLLTTACIILYSQIEGRFLISILCFLTLAYTLQIARTMYTSFWQSMVNELALNNQSKNQEVLVGKLQVLSQTDGLTDLYNRLYFDDSFSKEWSRACREGIPIGILLIDIDLFKNINDTFGHSFGDKCLQSLAQTLKKSMRRATDVIARYGGEEFIILMCNSDINAAAVSAKRILENVRNDKILDEDGQQLNLTCSIGITSTIPKHTEGSITPQDLINQADTALYKAKDTGRDKATLFDEKTQDTISLDDYNLDVPSHTSTRREPLTEQPVNQAQVTANDIESEKLITEEKVQQPIETAVATNINTYHVKNVSDKKNTDHDTLELDIDDDSNILIS